MCVHDKRVLPERVWLRLRVVVATSGKGDVITGACKARTYPPCPSPSLPAMPYPGFANPGLSAAQLIRAL